MTQGITPQQLVELMPSKPKIIDVRDPHFYSVGHIPTAVNIPYNTLVMYPERFLKLDENYILVCQSGSTSARAVMLLNMAGYHTLNLIGGQSMWRLH
ncbi:MAG TPA: rhodanese-like domain-containing protein [Firmicutes bacterium]|nr:rhodanese-like domain-containing protein [Bacillota bacterium]